MVTVEKIAAPREIFGNPLLHGAHRADVVRLTKLLGSGGIYLDADVFVHRSFDPLLGHPAVLGEERIDGAVVGLCNAIILAEPALRFCNAGTQSTAGSAPKGTTLTGTSIP